MILAITYAVVVFSIRVQGLTVEKLIKRTMLRHRRRNGKTHLAAPSAPASFLSPLSLHSHDGVRQPSGKAGEDAQDNDPRDHREHEG